MSFHQSKLTRAMLILCALFAAAPGSARTQATPAASPAASPVVIANDCDGLVPYFQILADLTREHAGLVILRGVDYDVLVLSDAEAATVVTTLDELIPAIDALDAPEPAKSYQAAYLEMMAWYRAMAADRDPIAHQRLINNDRQLFSQMGLAIMTGQTACGYEAWNAAYEIAFPPGS